MTMERFRLDGKTALVSGAGRGIGRECALALAEAGAGIVALARTGDELASLASEIEAAGGAVQTLPLDVTDSGAVCERINAAGEIDVLVNNAGINRPQPFLEVEEETLDEMLALNVKAAFLVAQTCARKMVAQGRGGSIVNISSQMGHVGGPNRSVYCATKHALEGLTKAMALELAEHEVRVNSIGPTFIETPLTRPMLADPAVREWSLSRIPLGRFGEGGEIASAVVFLASPAASLITGAALLIDGGWTAQ